MRTSTTRPRVSVGGGHDYESVDARERDEITRRNVARLAAQGTRARRIAALLELSEAEVEAMLEGATPST